ncbi:MAG: polysaccharide deacetylase family protein [Faecalimonas sp.]|nr:polysaccharide deacetylase family protein [Faecalimonas sp.]
MSRIDNRWFRHDSWARRHKKMIVGLLLVAILLFLTVFSYVHHEEITNTLKKIEGIGKEEKKEKEKPAPEKEEGEPEKPLVSPDQPMIALTFDDGPSIYTEAIVNRLEEYNARATFFVMGNRVQPNADLLRKMREIGCEIGNHSYSHPDLTKLTPEQVQAEIESTNQALAEVFGSGASLVRPTYGAVNDPVLQMPYPLVHWSVDTTDWQIRDGLAVIDNILGTVQDGDIVLLHDIYETTKDAMMALIPALQERGYQLVTVSELMEARGVTMQPGQKYYHARK